MVFYFLRNLQLFEWFLLEVTTFWMILYGSSTISCILACIFTTKSVFLQRFGYLFYYKRFILHFANYFLIYILIYALSGIYFGEPATFWMVLLPKLQLFERFKCNSATFWMIFFSKLQLFEWFWLKYTLNWLNFP